MVLTACDLYIEMTPQEASALNIVLWNNHQTIHVKVFFIDDLSSTKAESQSGGTTHPRMLVTEFM
jgi:hypothetical protein